MPIRVARIEPTPNPNARKIVIVGHLSDQPRSFFNAQDAIGDPIASRLFAIDGVCSVLLLRDFITVNKRPEANWKPVVAAVRSVLRSLDP